MTARSERLLNSLNPSEFDPQLIEWGSGRRTADVGTYPGLPGFDVRGYRHRGDRVNEGIAQKQSEAMEAELERLREAGLAIPEHRIITKIHASFWTSFALTRHLSGSRFNPNKGNDMGRLINLGEAVADYLEGTRVGSAFHSRVGSLASFKLGYPSGEAAPREWYFEALAPEVTLRERPGQPGTDPRLPSFAATANGVGEFLSVLDADSGVAVYEGHSQAILDVQTRAQRLAL